MSFNQFQVSGNLGNIPKIPNYWKSTNISETFSAKPETPPYGAYYFPENFTCTPLGQQGGLHRFPTTIPMTSRNNKSAAYYAMGGPSFSGEVRQQIDPATLVHMQPVVVSPTPIDVYPPLPGSSKSLASSCDASNNPMVYPQRPGTHPFMYPVPKQKLHYHLQFFAHPEAVPHSHYGHSKHVKVHNGAVRGLKKPIWFQGEEKAVAVKNLEEDFHGIRLQDCSQPPPIPNPNQVEVHQNLELFDGQQDEGEIVQVTDALSTRCTKQFSKKKQKKYCRLCKNNKETIKFFRSHNIRDEKGIVTCPILREHVCPYCKATGDNAHTLKYCPKRKRVPRTSQPSQQEQTGAPFHPRHMMRTSYGGYKLLKF